MPKPEPTWAQRAQNCKAELDGCHDQLERFKGVERMLGEANEQIRKMEQTAPDLAGLTKQIEFWKREAQTAQQREANLQGRVQQLDNALRQAPTRELVETLSVQLGEAKGDARRAAQQAAECTLKAAGMAQRLQQYQSATEALRAMEQAVDQWQRKATSLGKENNELRQELSALPELRAELARKDAGLREVETRLRQIEPQAAQLEQVARSVPSLKADLIQAQQALDTARRQAHQLQRELDQTRQQQADVEGTKRDLGDKNERLRKAAEHIARKEQELADALAELRRLRQILSDLKANVNRIQDR